MDQLDHTLLGIILKNWAAQVHPPVQTRARLLWLAAQSSQDTGPSYIPWRPRQRTVQTFNWSGHLMAWNPDHSFQANLPVVFSLV